MEAQQLLDRLNYHKSISSSTHAISTLQRMNPKLNDNNILTYANLALNPAITEEERRIFMECLRVKAQTEIDLYSKEINRILERREKCEE